MTDIASPPQSSPLDNAQTNPKEDQPSRFAPTSADLELDDEILVARVADGDVSAFTRLYDRYARPVYVLAAHTLASADAEEVVQEAFLRLWHKADQFDVRRGLFRTWFMTIARNNILDKLRQQDQKQVLMAVEQINDLLDQTANPLNPDVEEEVWLREQGKTILNALKRLPAEQRQAIILAYFGGFSQSSIAQHLGWPLGTVKKRTQLGLKKLRKALRGKDLALETSANSKRDNVE